MAGPILVLASIATVFAFSTAAPANEVVYDNGDPSGGFGTSVLSELESINQVGDDFALETDVVIQNVQWWGDGSGNDFRLRVFDASGGAPASSPIIDLDLGVVTGTSVSFGGGPIFEYSADVLDLVLPAGEYLLSIVEQGAGIDWFWAASCEDGCEGGSYRRESEGEPWVVGNWEMAFRLFGEFVDPAPCPDLDGSGDVGFGDVLEVIGAWGPCGAPCPEDLSGNGVVDFADILAVIAAWGPC